MTDRQKSPPDELTLPERLWERASKSEAWLEQAEASKLAGDKLWEARTTSGPGLDKEDGAYHITALMLFGFSLENLFKGLLIRRNPILRHNLVLGNVILNHDLVWLANAAGFSEESSHLKEELKTLTDFVMYAGRYPVPKSAKSGPTYSMWVPEWTKDMAQLWDKAHRELQSDQ